MDKITEKKKDEEQIIYRFPEMRIEIETFKISFFSFGIAVCEGDERQWVAG